MGRRDPAGSLGCCRLGALERQERLLEEQEALTVGVLADLRQQESLSRQVRDGLAEILQTERRTVELTREADQAEAATLPALTANARELDRLVAATARIEAGSRSMDGQLDRLLVELGKSAENFAVVERFQQAAGRATTLSTGWWDRLKEWWTW